MLYASENVKYVMLMLFLCLLKPDLGCRDSCCSERKSPDDDGEPQQRAGAVVHG